MKLKYVLTIAFAFTVIMVMTFTGVRKRGHVETLAASEPVPANLDTTEPGEDVLAYANPSTSVVPTTASTTTTTTTTVPPTTVPPTTVPVVTTPPDTTPPPPPPQQTGVYAAIQAHFGDGWLYDQAVRVAQCESQMNPNAVSPTNDHGIFQINRRWNEGNWTSVTGQPWSAVYDPWTNAQYARWLYGQRGWAAWTCQP